MISQSFTDENLREYFQISSTIFREVKGSDLPKTASDIWVILYDLAKFDRNKEVKISINKLADMISRSRSTVESYLRRLEKNYFIKRLPKFSKIGSQLISTYKVLIPSSILDKAKCSDKRVSIIPDNPIEKFSQVTNDIPDFPILDYDLNEYFENYPESPLEPINPINIDTPPVENCGPFNYPKDSNINNCYNLDKQDLVDNFSELPLETDNKDELEEYFPAKQKPKGLNKAVLRHMLTEPVKFEAKIFDHLTKAQEYIIRKIIAFWTAHRKVSSPLDCFNWFQSMLLNPKALSKCGSSFLKKINVISKMIREGRFSKPFVDRYRSREEFRAQKPERVTKPSIRLSTKEQEKLQKIEAFKASIKRAEEMLNSPEIQNNDKDRQGYVDLIQSMKYKIQEVQYA